MRYLCILFWVLCSSVSMAQESTAYFNRLVLKKGEGIVEKFDAQGDKAWRLQRVMIYFQSGEIVDATLWVGERGLFSYLPEEDGEMIAVYTRDGYVPSPKRNTYEIDLYHAAWRNDLFEVFEKKYSYKLQNYLRELLDSGKTEASRQVINHYQEVVRALKP